MHDGIRLTTTRHVTTRLYFNSLQFHVEYWGNISNEAKGLIDSLLTVDPRKRISAKQALANPWVMGSGASLAKKDLGKNLEEFKKFNARRKFKAAVKGVVASNMMKSFVGGRKGTSLERKLTEEDVADLRETFDMFDKDSSGTISLQELQGVTEKLGLSVTLEELSDVIYSVDVNNDGEIDFDEFLIMMKKIPDTEKELREAFAVFDSDSDGTTSRTELKRIMLKFGQKLTDQELDAVMAEVDDDGGKLCGSRRRTEYRYPIFLFLPFLPLLHFIPYSPTDGEISYEEFKRVMNA